MNVKRHVLQKMHSCAILLIIAHLEKNVNFLQQDLEIQEFQEVIGVIGIILNQKEMKELLMLN